MKRLFKHSNQWTVLKFIPYVAVICLEYEFSIQQVFLEHLRKLENRGYIKPQQK